MIFQRILMIFIQGGYSQSLVDVFAKHNDEEVLVVKNALTYIGTVENPEYLG